MAEFAVLLADRWPAALTAVAAIGVDLADVGIERGLRYYTCRRGRCAVGLAFGQAVPGGQEGVCLYAPGAAWWRRPLGMRRLSRDVWSVSWPQGANPPKETLSRTAAAAADSVTRDCHPR
jgi:hypothetical protein